MGVLSRIREIPLKEGAVEGLALRAFWAFRGTLCTTTHTISTGLYCGL